MKKLHLISSRIVSGTVLSLGFLAASGAFSRTALGAESPLTLNRTVVRDVRSSDAIPADADHVRKIVRLNIRLGGNPCSARGMKPIVEARQEGRTLNLYPRAARYMSDEPEVCTTEWRPVYATYEFEVSSRTGRFDEVIVHDVESFEGNTISVTLN